MERVGHEAQRVLGAGKGREHNLSQIDEQCVCGAYAIGLRINWMVLLLTLFFDISSSLTHGPWTTSISFVVRLTNVDLK